MLDENEIRAVIGKMMAAASVRAGELDRVGGYARGQLVVPAVPGTPGTVRTSRSWSVKNVLGGRRLVRRRTCR